MKPNDPRHIVTPDAFTVAPELLGTPLAGPWRRFWAMMIDLFVIAMLAALGGSILFAGAAAWFLFRAARGRGGGVLRRGGRFAFRAVGAVMAFVFVLVVWDAVGDWWSDDGDDAEAVASSEGIEMAGVSGVVAGVRFARETIELQNAEDSAQARRLASRYARRLDEVGVDEAAAADVLRNLAEGSEAGEEVTSVILGVSDSLAAVAAERAGDEAEPGEADPDSLALALAAALEAGDTAAADALRPRVGEALAAERIEELEDDVSGLREDRTELRQEIEEMEERGLRSLILTVADELGLEIGWLALYFGAFTWLWRGQTPGKRLLGVRVVRLDGEPLGLWASFERFGGYAASVFTGLFGFAQVLWDRNRQALHDKVVETVVVREGAPRVVPAGGFAPHRRWERDPARPPTRPDS